MAERTVNVTINYKVNTAEVLRAQAASAAAQKATDDLRKSTESYGRASTTAHRAASTSAKDTAASITGLYNTVKLLLAAGLVKEMTDASIQMAKLGGNVEAVSRAFKNQIPGAINLLKELRKATKGTVDDLILMQNALRAKNFGIAVERLPTLLKFAQIRAQQTGQSVEYLTNSIVDGLGRKSIRILDNLQVSASRLRDEFKGVSLESLSVAEVTRGFANVVDEELKVMGDSIENSATLVDQMTVAWKDFMKEFSDSLVWSFIIQRMKDVAEGATAVVKAIKGESFDEQIRKKKIADAASIAVTDFETKKLTKSREENIKLLEVELQRLTHQLGIFAKGKDLAEKTIKLNGELIRKSPYGADTHALRENIDLQRDWIADKLYDAEIDQETFRLLQEKLETLKDINDEEQKVTGPGIVEAKRKELESLQQQLEKSNSMGDLGEAGRLVVAIKEVQDELDILLGKVKDTGEGINDYLAYLSDQEMHQTKKLLEDKAEQRKHDAEVQKDNDQRSFEHWQYYQDLKKQKEQEYADEAIRIAEDGAAKRQQLQRQIADLTEQLISSTVDLVTQQGESETEAIRDKYSEQIQLAGDNERAKDVLRIKQERELEQAREREKEQEKKAATARISIDGLIAIGKIFSQFGWPAGIAPAAIMAGITALNIATVRKFAKGGVNIDGPGTETSDSIPAMLSKGESIIPADKTRSSMGLLKGIMANKIDDRILKKIDFAGGRTVNTLNDERIVNKLEAIRKSQYKLEEQGGILYRVHEDENGNKQRIRSKAI